MSSRLIDRISDIVCNPRELSAFERLQAQMAFEDTVAVTYAGWHEPVVQKILPISRGNVAPLLDGSHALSVEHATLVHAVAGHALDYDDVHMTSVTHPSVVIVPALLALIDQHPELGTRALTALAVGVSVNITLGEVLGFAHYDKGWHATSTIGPLAAAAAVCHLLGAEPPVIRSALAIAAAQSAGMQRNFGTMAKPVQAGTAAAAGLRAALFAQAGVTGSDDIFGPSGFFDIYRGAEDGIERADTHIEINMDSLSRKLFPCCYLTHRMIAGAFALRQQMGGKPIPPDARIEVVVPYGGTRPLTVTDPQTGLGAKFCAAYTVAAGLVQGHVKLADFEDDAIHRPDIRRLMSQIHVSEDRLEGNTLVGIDRGSVRMRIETAGRTLAETDIIHYPGSPGDPITMDQLTAKITDCLARYRSASGVALDAATFRADLAARLGITEMEPAQ